MEITKLALGVVLTCAFGTVQAQNLYVDPLSNVGVGTGTPIYQMDIIGSDSQGTMILT